MNTSNFFAELKRRHVYKVAGAYAVIGWLVVQIAATVLPTFHAPEWALQTLVVIVALGFPIALVLAWAFEVTPQGIKRTEDVSRKKSAEQSIGRRFAFIIIAGALTAAAFLALKYTSIATHFRTGRNPSPSDQETRLGTSLPIPEKSIAVLPFENLSANRENGFFTDGVQDEILTALAKAADLKVISRTTVMNYRNRATRNLPSIARELNVAHVLEGSVQRSENRVRVTAQLIDARTDVHLWAEHYDRPLDDVFAIQSEIAQKIAEQLQAVLSPNEAAAMHSKPTGDMAAYDLYLRAKEIDRRTATNRAEKMQEEVSLLDQAVARDPAFVPALCLLARAHLTLYWYNEDHSAARFELAKKAIEAAARLQPDAGDVHLTRAVFYYWGSRDYTPALAELALARRSLPNDAEVMLFAALIERRLGQWEESTQHLEEALAMDPRNPNILSGLATTNYFALRRYADAARILDNELVWKPQDFDVELERASVDQASNADLRRTERVLASDAAKNAEPNTVANNRMQLALAQRNYHAAEAAFSAFNRPEVSYAGFFTPREWYEGVIATGLANREKAHSAFLAARDRAAVTLAMRPEDAKAMIVLAEIDARLGRKDEAIKEGERALALLPVSKDAVDGPTMLTRLARIYAQAGEASRALDLLEQGARMPNGPDYGSLKLDEGWDPLRREPRFEKIVAALAPKNALP